MNKWLISGSSGFIGRALTARLNEQGNTVVPISRDLLRHSVRLKEFLHQQQPDYIVHLAAYGNHYDQTEAGQILYANIMLTQNLLTAANDVPYKKFFNFSTSSINLSKQTLYSISKHAASQLVDLHPRTFNIIPYSVFGPGEAGSRFIPTVIRALKTREQIVLDESATHDWIYISDFLDAFLNGHTEIGTGIKHTNLEIVRKLEEISGKMLLYKPGKLRNYDNNNWVCGGGVPHLSIEETLLKTYLYYTNGIK